MARNVTLSDLLIRLRAEARLSQSSANNNQTRDTQVAYLQRTQQWLWDNYEWPHLRVERFIDLRNGQRFYDPTQTFDTNGDVKGDLSLDRIERIELRYGDTWIPLTSHIGMQQYNEWSSELDERSWPVLNWAVYEDEMVEVWPIPSQDAVISAGSLEGRMKLIGIRNLRPLVDDSDRCDIDSEVLTLTAAAEFTANKDLARYKLDLANQRLDKLQNQLVKTTSFTMLGVGQSNKPRRPRRMSAIYIAPSGS